MRTVLRYEQGRAVWSDNIPAAPVMRASRGGTLVTGTSKHDLAVESQRRYTARQRAELAAELAAAIPSGGPGRRAYPRPEGFVFVPQPGVKRATMEERVAARRESWRRFRLREKAKREATA